MAIKYTPEYNKKIRQEVNAFNKRVGRLQKKYGTRRVAQPVSVKGLKSAYTTRADMDRKLKLLHNYNEQTMNDKIMITKENVRTNKYEWQTFKLNHKVADRNLSKLVKKSEQNDKREGRFFPSQRTRSLRAQKTNLGDGKIKSYRKYITARKIASRYSDKLEKTNQTFYENFFDMLWSNQEFAGIDADAVQDAHDMFESLSPEQLLELYNNEPDVMRLVEDYHLYHDTGGEAVTDTEAVRARVRFENLMEELPQLIAKYKKM